MRKLVLHLLFILLLTTIGQGAIRDKLKNIKLPPGFKIRVYSDQVPNARGMVISDNGILYVGSRNEGKVYAVIDEDNDFSSDKVIILADNLKLPVGVDLYDGDLYVSEVSRIIKFKDVDNNLTDFPKPEVVYDEFPEDRWHGWKFIKFGPDNRLYIPVGAPCNVCLEEERIYSTIMRMNPDGSGLEIFAEGVRNTVGFDWHPDTGILWFTENGRDWMGDNRPPDELNSAPEKGLHFGFPFIHGKDLEDPEYWEKKPPELNPVYPELELGPHVAALGMRFYTGEMFPDEYRNVIFIAEHGSWNRTEKIGYRITMVTFKDGKPDQYKVFAEGWLDGQNSWGRPVDIEIMKDGSILVSDDKAGAIYRISYTQKINK